MKSHDLREEVCRINRELGRSGLVTLTWGNASGVDREAGVMAIKPSGVDYAVLTPEDIALVSLESGEVVAGLLRASSDTPTHLCLYRHFEGIGGIVHTHSTHATAWAQAGRELPCLGTTHADHFHGAVPVARPLTEDEVAGDYEWATGMSIVDRFREVGVDPLHLPAILLPGHAPFVWGEKPAKALENAIALEAAAEMAMLTLRIDAHAGPLPAMLQEKHFQRKHGPGAYYGQPA
jgi:L-ribulose-5-phosphate 4-epimerase